MTIYSRYLVYPEDDMQTAPVGLSVDQIVDINGIPLELPLPTVKMIAYRVYRIVNREERGEANTYYHLELVRRDEMLEYAAPR